ncbi:conserved hypothetical protein [uncultured Paludibacter sp.]|uniref:Uncharacterized protein n=1 Tax=uncultured Paludibacter sp. TaxID=497635 RepID=A0A653AJW6_9BACT|nr:conserved hypothetical protein [uncultured Paludibacter sp.]
MEEIYSVLRLYVSNTDKIGLDTVYEYIVQKAHKQGISGATVYKGVMGYGLSSDKIVSARFWEISEKLPVVVEIIDKTEVLQSFYKTIENELKALGKGCLVYMIPINVLLHQSGKK